MNKMKIVLLLIFILSFATGCVNTANDLSQQIVPPNNAMVSIQGTWEITEVLSQQSEDSQEWIGKEAHFDNEFVVIGKDLLKNPRYQIKKVDQGEYLLYHSKAFPVDFRFSKKEIEVITITDQDLFYCEVIREKEDELLLKIYNDTFLLKKISEEIDEGILEKLKEEHQGTQGGEPEEIDGLIRTGVLIGLREAQNTSQEEVKYDYRTLWVASKNRQVSPIVEIDDIFFPRKSGFWKFEIEKMTLQNITEDYLTANNILTKDEKILQELAAPENIPAVQKEVTLNRVINYIGNDYVSIEEIATMKDKEGQPIHDSRFKLLPIDSLPNTRGVSIVDLLGAPGSEAMEEGRNQILGDSLQQDNLWVESGHDNFGLERRLGHWFFKGRINYRINQESFSEDYNINLIPPAKLISYDELTIPWTDVKDKIPSAVDVYTSPNEDIALVVTKTELLIYEIYRGRLQHEPLERISLENETVIMAEWATGPYVENWEKTLNSYVQALK